MTDKTLTPNRAAGRRRTSSPDTPEVLAEQHLMRRILIATAIAVPIGAAVFALLVAGAMVIAGQAVVVPAAMGAGIGILAGSFFGIWAGFVASVSELDTVDLHLHRSTDPDR
jgi:uncharacterized membrane protein